MVDRIQRLVRRSGRHCVTLFVGRLNPAKLANLPELDILVLVACAETSVLDSREFLIPMVTPFEFECALSTGTTDVATVGAVSRVWTGERFWTDFRDLLPGKCLQFFFQAFFELMTLL